MSWRVWYFRPHRGADNGETVDPVSGETRPMAERRDVTDLDVEPTEEAIAAATGDVVLRIDEVHEHALVQTDEQLPQREDFPDGRSMWRCECGYAEVRSP